MSLPTIVNLTHFTNDVFKLDTTILFDPDQDVTSLTGGSVRVVARNRSDDDIVVGTGSVDVPNDIVRALFPSGALSRGVYDLQVIVTISGDPKTVISGTLAVKESY